MTPQQLGKVEIIKWNILLPESFIQDYVAVFQYYLPSLNNIAGPQYESIFHTLNANPQNLMQSVCSDTEQPSTTSVGF